MSRPLRVAVVGAGGIASRHIGNIITLDAARLVGVADPLLARAEEQASRGDAPGFADWREMLEALLPDALLICLPPFAHGDPEIAAAEAGIPYFVEKPVAVDFATARRIADAVDAAGIPTGVGYQWRYLDTVERARDLLAERPAHLAAGFWWDATPPRAWWVQEALSGGQMVEQTTHIFDLSRHLIGEAERVSAVVRRVHRDEPPFEGADVPDVSLATVEFASGAIASFSSTTLPRWPHRMALHLVSEGMVIELTEEELMVDVGRGRPLIRPTVDPFVAEMSDFLAAAAGAANRIRAPFGEALQTQQLTTAATESARTGRPIDLTPAAREAATGAAVLSIGS